MIPFRGLDGLDRALAREAGAVGQLTISYR